MAITFSGAEAPTTTTRLTYIPALDGVRALAVLAVMSFHFGQDWLPGGFIGVDVFFVLSGFLITTLLVERSPQAFSLPRFWLQRARRLFPALALMLVGVALYALTTPTLEQATIRDQSLATLFYVNNWWLLHTGVSYFDAYQSPSPLLHTWSLSVEEQWYLVFPLLLGCLILLRRFRLSVVFAVCLLLTMLSIAWTQYLTVTGAVEDRIYLGTDTRAQQLLIGALLGIVGVAMVRRYGIRVGRLSPRQAAVIGWTGLLGLGLLATVWRPPALLLVTALFSAALIIGAIGPGGRLTSWLAWEPLRRIGVISYGLYLWHWPISVMVDDRDTNVTTLLRLVLTFTAAGLSYAIVERPIRRWGLRKVGRLMLLLPIPLLALIFLCTPKAGEANTLRTLPEQAAFDFHGAGTKVFVVGDSVGGSLWQPAWESPRSDLAISGSFLLGCPPIDLRFLLSDGSDTETGPPPGTTCSAWLQQWRDDVERLDPDVVLLVASAQFQFDVSDGGPQQTFGSAGYKKLLYDTLDRSFAGLSVPRIAITSPPCTALGSNPINDAKNDRSRTGLVRDLLRQYAQARGYDVVDLAAFTCLQDTPSLYMDGIHFTKKSSQATWDWMAPQLNAMAPVGSSSTTATPQTKP